MKPKTETDPVCDFCKKAFPDPEDIASFVDERFPENVVWACWDCLYESHFPDNKDDIENG